MAKTLSGYDYTEYNVWYVQECNGAEVLEEIRCDSGYMYLQAVKFDGGQAAIGVNGEIAYHSHDINAVNNLYNSLKRN